jgi:hypothetical protein
MAEHIHKIPMCLVDESFHVSFLFEKALKNIFKRFSQLHITEENK